MNLEHIGIAIESLKRKQKIFHSEADFQFSLAWELQKILPDASIRLEYCPSYAQEMHIDIYIIENDYAFPIELKYKTKCIETTVDNEYFNLKNHGAQDFGRYDYLHDISRIEKVREMDKKFQRGYAIILTNEPSYWKNPIRETTMDSAFRIYEGRKILGSLSWREDVNLSTSRNRINPIVLTSEYTIHWDVYSEIPNSINGLFKISVIEVTKQ